MTDKTTPLTAAEIAGAAPKERGAELVKALTGWSPRRSK
jgi:hypothetical protein